MSALLSSWYGRWQICNYGYVVWTEYKILVKRGRGETDLSFLLDIVRNEHPFRGRRITSATPSPLMDVVIKTKPGDNALRSGNKAAQQVLIAVRYRKIEVVKCRTSVTLVWAQLITIGRWPAPFIQPTLALSSDKWFASVRLSRPRSLKTAVAAVARNQYVTAKPAFSDDVMVSFYICDNFSPHQSHRWVKSHQGKVMDVFRCDWLLKTSWVQAGGSDSYRLMTR